MNTTVEREDAEIAYTWGRSDETYYLRNQDDEFRGVSENVIKLLDDLATGEVTRSELPENALGIVNRLERLGYVRSDGSVRRIRSPDDIRLWPRTILFVVLTAVAVWVALQEYSIIWQLDELLTPVQIATVVVLGLATFAVHEAGHHLASRPFIDVPITVGTINGVIPAMISDTNDAWMLPRNRRRWINLAGPFAHAVWLVGLSVVYYGLFPSNPAVQLTIVLFTVALLGNLNPLIHGDGYWLLVDTFGIVNLRTRGIEDLRNRTPSLPATYVVLSYSMAGGFFVLSVYYLLLWGPVGIVLAIALVVFVGIGAREQLWGARRWLAHRM